MPKYIDVDKFRKESLTWLDGTCLVVAVEELDRAPAADVAPIVHGEWITTGDELKNTICSNCGHWVETPYGKTPYCPRCGAKMKRGNK